MDPADKFFEKVVLLMCLFTFIYLFIKLVF